MCGFCHYRPQNKNDRCHNRANCPKRNSAEICGDLKKHDDEKQIVNKLKTKIEKLEIKFSSQQYDLRKGYLEKTVEKGIQERILLEVPERYFAALEGEMLITLF